MDQTGGGRWCQSLGDPKNRRSPNPTKAGRSATTGEVVSQGGRSLWVPWSRMEQSTSSTVDRARIWCEVPSGPCQPHSERIELDTPKADRAGQATEAGRDRALVAGTLAEAQKKFIQQGRTLVFVDESGFYLLPMVVRSYAPCGLTPILKEFLSRDHLAVIGAVTPQGKLFLKTYPHAISSIEVIEFLKFLQRQIAGLLLIVWDGSPTHRSKKLKMYLSNGAAKCIHLELFPSYAPELNPTEWVWSYLKLGPLANVACHTLPELVELIQKAKQRLKHDPDLIKSFIQHVGYKV
jgi:transposase